MSQLKRCEFKCPFCGKQRVTLITLEKETELKSREKLIQDIFAPRYFGATYREIFVSKICSLCQINTFGGSEDDKSFDVDENENVEPIEGIISEMYENAERQ